MLNNVNREKDITISNKTTIKQLQAYFFTGVLVITPIAITLYIAYSFLIFVDSVVTPIIPPDYNPNTYLPFALPGLGLIIAVLFFIKIGWFARNFLGQTIIKVSEYIVDRIPILSPIHKAIKQALQTLMTDQTKAFREAVLLEFPRKGTWVVGFVTGSVADEFKKLSPNDEMLNVYVPTAPLPTQGFLLFVPRRKLVSLNMKVDEAIKMIVTGGIVTPTT